MLETIQFYTANLFEIRILDTTERKIPEQDKTKQKNKTKTKREKKQTKTTENM